MGKRTVLLKVATQLFADQGFEATTTIQIARTAKTTEPLIFYHFKSKDRLFGEILKGAFEIYFQRMGTLPAKTDRAFEMIERLIMMHLDLVAEMPNEIKLILSTCPSRFNDENDLCTSLYRQMREQLGTYILRCLRSGSRKKEFRKVPQSATTDILIALINGLMRQKVAKIGTDKNLAQDAVGFCRRSLLPE